MFSAGFEKVSNIATKAFATTARTIASPRMQAVGQGSIARMRQANQAMALKPSHSIANVAKTELSSKIPDMNMSATALRRRQNFMGY